MAVVLPERCDRDSIMNSLREAGIQSSLHYRPFWTFTAYKELDPSDTPNLLKIHDRLISLPLSPGYSVEEVDTVITALKNQLN